MARDCWTNLYLDTTESGGYSGIQIMGLAQIVIRRSRMIAFTVNSPPDYGEASLAF